MGSGFFVLFFVSVCILVVVLIGVFCFGLGCLVYFLWAVLCAFSLFYTFLALGR